MNRMDKENSKDFTIFLMVHQQMEGLCHGTVLFNFNRKNKLVGLIQKGQLYFMILTADENRMD